MCIYVYVCDVYRVCVYEMYVFVCRDVISEVNGIHFEIWDKDKGTTDDFM